MPKQLVPRRIVVVIVVLIIVHKNSIGFIMADTISSTNFAFGRQLLYCTSFRLSHRRAWRNPRGFPSCIASPKLLPF
jgi:hypothetical protein